MAFRSSTEIKKTLLSSALIFLMGCQNREKVENNYLITQDKNNVVVSDLSFDEIMQSMKSGKTVSLEFYQFLFSGLSEVEKQNAFSYVADNELNSNELSAFIKRQNNLRDIMLFENHSKEIIKASVLKQTENDFGYDLNDARKMFNESLRERNKHYLEILKQFEEQLKNDRIETSSFLMAAINEDFLLKQEVQSIDLRLSYEANKKKIEDLIEKILKAKNIQNKLDVSNSTFYVSAGLGASFYLALKDNSTFAKFKGSVDEVKQKIRSIILYGGQISKMKENIFSENIQLKSSLSQMEESSASLFNRFKDDLKNENPKGSQSTSFKAKTKKLYDLVVGNKKNIVSDEVNIQIKAYQEDIEKIEKSLIQLTDVVGSYSRNARDFVSSTRVLAKALDVRLGKDVEKALNKINNVASVAEKVAGAIKLAMGQNYLGAASALVGFASGDPFQAQINGKLDQISSKLDVMHQLNLDIYKAQIETMKMISNLALLVDEQYMHQLNLLNDIRDIGLVNSGMLLSLVGEDVSQCDFVLEKKIEKSLDRAGILRANKNAGQLYFQDLFYSQESSKREFQFIASQSKKLENCYDGLIQVFRDSDLSKGLLSFEYLIAGEQVYLEAQRDFRKVVGFFTRNHPESSLFSFDVPVSKVTSLEAMNNDLISEQVFGRDFLYTDQNFVTLLSVKKLEEVVGSLLLLYPLLDIDLNAWERGPRAVLKSYTEGDLVSVRPSFDLLKQALKLTKIAIGQEAFIAGTPVLQDLVRNYERFANSDIGMNESNLYRSDFMQALYHNKLLMRNLLVARIHSNLSHLNTYTEAYEIRDIETLSRLLGGSGKMVDSDTHTGELMFYFSSSNVTGQKDFISLPTPEEIKEGKIQYTTNMKRLLDLQDRIIHELLKFYPEKVSPQEGELVLKLIVQ